MLFPDIISRICDEPCKSACVRKIIDESISVRMLEKACCDYSATKDIPVFYIPPKTKCVVVVGGGLGGLSCAVKLARRGYEVHLYEEKNTLGGTLRKPGSLVPPQVLEEEFSRIIRKDDIKLHLNNRVRFLDEIEFDALYIYYHVFDDKQFAA